jgi:hypothetical protein
MLRATPPGEDGIRKSRPSPNDGTILPPSRALARAEQGHGDAGMDIEDDDDMPFDEKPSDEEFLEMCYEADQQALQYINQVNRDQWERGYRAFHQEHFQESKYLTRDYNNRSKLFVPKTRTSVRKDMAATAASLFGSIDAVNCAPGNEGDPIQRGAAAVIKELVNYRTDRATSKASMPWFHIAMGARQTSLITGICLSKQSWKLELRRKGTEKFRDDPDDDLEPEKERDVWVPHIDRPDSELLPPENFVIDPAADWTNPAQDAAYLILKFPMRLDEIRRRQRDPRNPWLRLDENLLKSAGEGAQQQMEAIRRSREQGLDRFDDTQNTRHFDVIWVWESFIRVAGEDWCFVSIGNRHLLTEPRPVREVYPEQDGERPLVLGYGSLEAFRIFPMSNVESWQQLQQEANDIRNLSLDALKQNIMPVTKVRRGRNVDLEQLKRRGQGSSILVNDPDDVTWEQTPTFPGQVIPMTEKLDIEFDDLAGQSNYGTVQNNNALGKTLGGLKLAAGAANAVQEFDIRIWIETWCEQVITQIVRLEQYYESDPIVLGICGDRAKLFEKHGINKIDDNLLEQAVTVRVNIGLGAGDPEQRLAKFNSATQIALPLLELSPEFKSGKKVMDFEAVMAEVYGAAGYRDGGKRFVKNGDPQQPNPAQDATVDKLKSEAERNRSTAKAAVVNALTNAAKIGIAIGQEERQKILDDFDMHYRHVDQMGHALDLGHQHGHGIAERQNAARGLNPDGSPMLPPGTSPGPGGGEGGGPSGNSAGVVAGGGAGPPPENPGEGNQGVAPSQLGDHGVPASDAGQQGLMDQAAHQQELERALKKQPKKMSIAISKRGPDGRASAFEVTHH